MWNLSLKLLLDSLSTRGLMRIEVVPSPRTSVFVRGGEGAIGDAEKALDWRMHHCVHRLVICRASRGWKIDRRGLKLSPRSSFSSKCLTPVVGRGRGHVPITTLDLWQFLLFGEGSTFGGRRFQTLAFSLLPYISI